MVLRVSVIDNSNILDEDGNESESVGVAYINGLRPHEAGQFTWKQTSYNNNFRGNYAGIGMVYMEGVATLGVASTDVFMPPRPASSWTLNSTTPTWDPPIPRPDHTQEMSDNYERWSWDEDAYQADNTTGWVKISGRAPKPHGRFNLVDFDTFDNLIYNRSEYIISAWHINPFGTSAICLKML